MYTVVSDDPVLDALSDELTELDFSLDDELLLDEDAELAAAAAEAAAALVVVSALGAVMFFSQEIEFPSHVATMVPSVSVL